MFWVKIRQTFSLSRGDMKKKSTLTLGANRNKKEIGKKKQKSLKTSKSNGANLSAVYLMVGTVLLSLLFYFLGNRNLEIKLPTVSFDLPSSTYQYELD